METSIGQHLRALEAEHVLLMQQISDLRAKMAALEVDRCPCKDQLQQNLMQEESKKADVEKETLEMLRLLEAFGSSSSQNMHNQEERERMMRMREREFEHQKLSHAVERQMMGSSPTILEDPRAPAASIVQQLEKEQQIQQQMQQEFQQQQQQRQGQKSRQARVITCSSPEECARYLRELNIKNIENVNMLQRGY